MKRFRLILPLLFLVLTACGFVEAGIETGGTATAVLIPTPLATPTLAIRPDDTVSTATAVPALPTFNPDDPFHFTNIRFAAHNTIQDKFPAGTEEVFAWWDYHNMTADTVVKRIWYLNNQEWLVREETWDFEKYGAIGTITDISIYDFEGSGLTPGVYSLALYVNGILQVDRPFTVLLPETAVSYPDSTGTRVVRVWGGLLFRQQGNNDLQLLAQGNEIGEVVWFPDGFHLLYVDVNRSQQIASSTVGIKHALWVVDATGGNEPVSLGSFAEDFHTAQISPDGRFISLFSGSGFGDACFVDTIFYLMEVDGARQKTALYDLADFAGAPTSDTYWIYPVTSQWNTDNTLTIHLNMYCVDEETAPAADLLLRGIFRLDPQTLQATRIGELP